MTANVDAMVRDAIRAYRAGKKAEARTLLERATDLDQNNEQAWMWLSAVVDSIDEQRICLENVLYLNPDNANAKRGLEMLNKQSQETSTVSPTSPEEPADDPFASVSFTQTESPPPSTSSAPPTATSSASSVFNPADEPAPEVYDDWVSGLGIGEDASASILADPVDDSDIGDEFENLFSDSFTFGSEDNEVDADLNNMFGDSGESEALASGPFTSDAFGFDDDFDLDTSTSPAKQSVFDDDFESLDDFLDDIPDTSTAKPSKKPRGKMSPVEKPRARASGAFVSDDFGGMDDLDPSEYFKAIPKGIKATRVPGTNESRSAIAVMSFLLLLALNIGAIGMLVANLSG